MHTSKSRNICEIGFGAALLGGSVLSGLFGSRQAKKSMDFQRTAAKARINGK